MAFDVCVIGAGVVGLSTALNVQKLMRLAKVTIIADSFGMETNTPVTGGLFIPAPIKIKDVDPFLIREWYADSWKHHLSLATSKEREESGNTLQSGDCLWYHPGDYIIKNNVLNYRALPRKEMDRKEYIYESGCEFTTVHIDFTNYIRWLLKQIRKNGGEIIYDTVFSLQQFYGKYDVVINCIGKRGRELLADECLHKCKGTMVQLSMQESDRFFATQDDIYVCPNPIQGVCDVGFIWDHDSTHLEEIEDTNWLVVHRAAQFVPGLKERSVIRSWAEYRPHREPILLEKELLDCGGPILPVIHNIGQGQNTISLAWGRGVHAAHLVQEFRRTSRPFARIWRPFNTV